MGQTTASQMSRDHQTKHRSFTRYVAIATLVLLMPVFAFATAVAATGTITVNVSERGADGARLYVPVPALLVDLAVFLAPRLMPEDALDEMRAEIAPFKEGLVAIAKEIESCPSGVLVEVDTPTERIRVTKNWRTFDIEVDSDDADIRVAVPARLMSRVLAVL